MTGASGTAFRAQMQVDKQRVFDIWLAKRGRIQSEKINGTDRVCTFIMTKVTRKSNLDLSLATFFAKHKVPITNVIVDFLVMAKPDDVNITNLVNGFMIGGRVVRKTLDTPPKVSVYDLIEVVTEQCPNASRKIYLRIISENQEVAALCSHLKFSGAGQRPTPVTDARGVVTILNLLPGRKAAAFRAASANVMVRFMGGDLTIIAEIQRNAEAQQNIPDNHPARLFGSDVEDAAVQNARGEVKYSPNVSTLVIEPGTLTGFDESGVYLIVYGKKMLYNLEGLPENVMVIGFGHAKTSGSLRCAEHRAKTGAGTRVLDFVQTPFYEQCERRLENRLKALGRIVKGNIEGTLGEMREQFYVVTPEDYATVLRGVQADADTLKTQVQVQTQATDALLLEQEKTKQITAEASVRSAEFDSAARMAEANASVRMAEANASVRVKELELRILELQMQMREVPV